MNYTILHYTITHCQRFPIIVYNHKLSSAFNALQLISAYELLNSFLQAANLRYNKAYTI